MNMKNVFLKVLQVTTTVVFFSNSAWAQANDYDFFFDDLAYYDQVSCSELYEDSAMWAEIIREMHTPDDFLLEAFLLANDYEWDMVISEWIAEDRDIQFARDAIDLLELELLERGC